MKLGDVLHENEVDGIVQDIRQEFLNEMSKLGHTVPKYYLVKLKEQGLIK